MRGMPMTNISKIVLLACLPFLLATQRLEAAETTVIRFACDGKLRTGSMRPEPVQNIRLVVNIDKRTVAFAGLVAPLKRIDTANIYFSGTSTDPYGMALTVDGNVDRGTGALDATAMTTAVSGKTSYATTTHWEMLCRPRTRLF